MMINLFHKRPVKADMGLIIFVILVISIMIMMVLVMILVILTILTWQERLLLLPPPCSTSRSKALLKAPFLPEISDWHLYLHSSFYIFCLKKKQLLTSFVI